MVEIIEENSENYRPCVGIVLINNGFIFAGQDLTTSLMLGKCHKGV